MPDIAHSAIDMISGMEPVLLSGSFVFVSTIEPEHIAELSPHAISTFRETEGLSIIVPADLARTSVFNTDSPMRCITLNVYSSLEGVGLTAAVSAALGDASIPCNVVAAHHHDHLFVPADQAGHAMAVLSDLQKQASTSAK